MVTSCLKGFSNQVLVEYDWFFYNPPVKKSEGTFGGNFMLILKSRLLYTNTHDSVFRISFGLVFLLFTVIVSLLTASTIDGQISYQEGISVKEKIRLNRNNEKLIAELLPIVRCSFQPSKYERILMTRLRDKNTSTKEFREITKKIGELLISKVIDCLPSQTTEIETPLAIYQGVQLNTPLDLVSIMRSGDALLETFIDHFPEANVNKILVQRDEKTAKPYFVYMKLSSTLKSGHPVVITEPMIATGGSLEMSISLLKEQGVLEENIIIASVCTAPEGLILLNEKFPKIRVVFTELDDELNENKFILPGLGDFGDRYFGSQPAAE